MMRHLLALLVASFVAVTVAGCAWFNRVDPPIKPVPTKDYPCGVTGVECGGGWCCSEGETCGGNGFPHTCPPGECCFIGGGGTYGAALKPQTRAR